MAAIRGKRPVASTCAAGVESTSPSALRASVIPFQFTGRHRGPDRGFGRSANSALIDRTSRCKARMASAIVRWLRTQKGGGDFTDELLMFHGPLR